MAQPVWVLSVDLQTKTATFNSGLAEAAKSARGTFADIKSGAGEMGNAVGYSTMEARHSVMMLGEEFGVHLPRALTSFIAGLGPVGAALEAAFPFLAIALGATLLIEHLVKMHEAGEKLTDDQVRFGTAVETAFNTLDNKILQAQIRADELRNDHLGALKHQLELIDKTSMAELVKSFEEVAKSADVVMKDLEGHWYTFGIGSAGAKHALDQFQTQYKSLLAQGKQGEASDLLAGTLHSAKKVLEFQRQYQDNQTHMEGGGNPHADYAKFEEAALALKVAGVGVTKNELDSQVALVDALNAQVGIQGKVNELKAMDKGNAGKAVSNEGASQAAAAARQAAESQARIAQQSLAGDRATKDAQLQIERASIEARLAVDLAFADRERDIQLAANAAQMAGLDRSGKDYVNQLKGLKEKVLEIEAEHNAKTAELTAKASIAENTRDLGTLQQGLREKIEATQQGSAARLTVIDAAIREEQSLHLQDSNFYKELLNMRVETLRQETTEEAKLTAEAAREEAENGEKMGELALAAEKQRTAMEDSARRVTIQQRIAEDTKFANQEFDIKMKALQKEVQGLDKSGKDYQNKLKQLQNKELQLTRQHENEITAIKEKAEQERNQRIMAADTQFNDSIARGLTQSIMGHETWAKMVTSLGNEVVAGMIQNAIKSMLTQDMTKEKDAAAAARKAFNIGMSIGGPAGMVLGPVMGAAAFTAVMAFNEGTDSVPGVGRMDSVPTMLTPGEGVVPGGVMDGLRQLVSDGGLSRGQTIHATAHFAPTVHALDAEGVDRVLTEHSDKFQRHFERTLRKMNR